VPFWSIGVYHKTKEERKGPWDFRAIRVRMLGYDEKVKNGYRVLVISTGKVLTRLECIWDETEIVQTIGADNINGDLEPMDDLSQLEEEIRSRNIDQHDNEEPRVVQLDEEDESTTSKYYDEEPVNYWYDEDASLVYQWIEDVSYLNTTMSSTITPDTTKLPATVEEALAGPDAEKWKAAIDKEWNNFQDRGVFGPTSPTGRAMKTKIILQKKTKNDGSIIFKARLVAKGYSQIYGLDYKETYAPTTSTCVVMIALQLCAQFGFHLSCFDVTAAFLEGKNDYQNFAVLPKILGGHRVEVLGNFYGEKQGPKIWNDQFNDIVIKRGFERCPAHPCMYRYTDLETDDFIFLVVHVDDGLVITNNMVLVNQFRDYFLTRVKNATFEKEVKKYIGIDLKYDQEMRVIQLKHEQYIANNWDTYCKDVKIPMAPTSNLRTAVAIESDESMLEDTGKFRFIVDRARPDCMVACGEIATRGDKNPSLEHKKVSERTKNYLSTTRQLGLQFASCPEGIVIFGYSDAAYITDGNCKSRLGGCIFMNYNSGAIRSFSKNDTILSSVSHSSCEAEIKAIDEWIREVMHIVDISNFLIGKYTKTIELFVDNKSAIELCSTLKQSHKVKHINLRIHFIREMILMKFVSLNFIRTDYNVADILTKPISEEGFKRHRDILLMGHDNKNPLVYCDTISNSNSNTEVVHCSVDDVWIQENCLEDN
ncbi:MAG: reverse transcriptase domain-containing protein, partial [Nitrosopumilaceae archaeon]|nr:reverse transcriptase domain-containing protein [Nitrosopumilaceae archaeon]